MNAVTLPASKTTAIAIWVLRVLVAAIFLSAGVMKLIGAPMLVEEFGKIGLGQWFRYLTGALEVGGSIALLTPAVSVFGALLLLAVDIGACIAQVTTLHEDWIHTVVIGALIAAVIYLQRGKLASALGR